MLVTVDSKACVSLCLVHEISVPKPMMGGGRTTAGRSRSNEGIKGQNSDLQLILKRI